MARVVLLNGRDMILSQHLPLAACPSHQRANYRTRINPICLGALGTAIDQQACRIDHHDADTERDKTAVKPEALVPPSTRGSLTRSPACDGPQRRGSLASVDQSSAS